MVTRRDRYTGIIGNPDLTMTTEGLDLLDCFVFQRTLRVAALLYFQIRRTLFIRMPTRSEEGKILWCRTPTLATTLDLPMCVSATGPIA